MKKYLFITILILSLSCDSTGLGVEELQSELTYYEYVGFGWQHFMDQNYTTAIDYFNAALESEDELYHNSAHIGIGWANLMIANQYIGSEGTVNNYRDLAYDKFLYDTDQDLAVQSYNDNCEYLFCCDSCFVNDRNVGIMFHESLEYLESEDSNALDTLTVDLINNFINFHNTDDNFYNFMDGKPSGLNNQDFNLTTNNIIILLAQIYMRNNNFSCAMDLLFENNLCSNYDLYDSDCCDSDCDIDIDIIPIIECLENYTTDY